MNVRRAAASAKITAILLAAASLGACARANQAKAPQAAIGVAKPAEISSAAQPVAPPRTQPAVESEIPTLQRATPAAPANLDPVKPVAPEAKAEEISPPLAAPGAAEANPTPPNTTPANPGAPAVGELDPDLEKILSNLNEARGKLTTFSAKVLQDRDVPALDIHRQADGAIKFQMPRLLRMELTDVLQEGEKEAMQRIYVIGEKYLWLYRPQQKQAERFTLAEIGGKAEESANPFEYGLAVDLRQLDARYVFQLKDDVLIAGKSAAVIELIPREETRKTTNYSRLIFAIDRELWLPVRVAQYKDNDEVVETYTLAEIELNLKLKSSLFEFKPPRGTDVIEHEL